MDIYEFTIWAEDFRVKISELGVNLLEVELRIPILEERVSNTESLISELEL